MTAPNVRLPEDQYWAARARGVASAGMLFMNCRDEILLLRTAHSGGWQLPGGGRDAGETPSECAVREVREEMGWVVQDDVKLVGVAWATGRAGDDTTTDAQFVFTTRLPYVEFPPVVLSDEHQGWTALTLDGWRKRLSPEGFFALEYLHDAVALHTVAYAENGTALLFFGRDADRSQAPTG